MVLIPGDQDHWKSFLKIQNLASALRNFVSGGLWKGSRVCVLSIPRGSTKLEGYCEKPIKGLDLKHGL